MIEPCLEAQMNPLATNSGWPNYGRDDTDHGCAIFTVAAYLEVLGLKNWTNNFLLWLAHYEGFERHIEETNDPVMQVRDVLVKYVIAGKRCSAENKAECESLLQDIARSILERDFMYYKAFWGDDPMFPTGGKKFWNPAQQSWLSFLEHRPPDEDGGEVLLYMWKGDEPHTPLTLLQDILLRDT